MKKYIVPLGFLAIGLALCSLGVISYVSTFAKPKEGEFAVQSFARLPVQSGGRILPVDSVARNTLRILQQKTTVKLENGVKVGPDQWILDLAFKPNVADAYPVFRIDHPEVLGLFGWEQRDRKYFSWDELEPHFEMIQRQAQQIPETKDERTPFQEAIAKLTRSLMLYNQIGTSFDPGPDYQLWPQIATPGAQEFAKRERGQETNERILEPFLALAQYYMRVSNNADLGIAPPGPDAENNDWLNVGEGMLQTIRTGELNPAIAAYGAMADAYNNDDPTAFGKEAKKLKAELSPSYNAGRVAFEQFFNHFQPFFYASVLYVLIFLLVSISWLKWPATLQGSAFWLLLLAFAVHTFGLVARMYIQERPPVTNLYSSAIFVGWGAILLGVVLEGIYKIGVGSFVAAVIGFCTLVIAHNLALTGDTLEMMQAVLDSNFWLATHVVVITAGYSAVFLAGALGLIYVLRGVLTPSLDKPTARALYGMSYGVTCFGLLFSFVGTMLGGIWADQSWGRFWGWDPKENGALIIVLWGALMLHARWGGLVKERGFMLLAIGGNIITAWSWFGTNMLGIGLHSYGFMDKAFVWLMIFWASQLAFIGIGLLPKRWWMSRIAAA